MSFLLGNLASQPCGSLYRDGIMPRGEDRIAVKTREFASPRNACVVHLMRNPFNLQDPETALVRRVVDVVSRL